MSDKIENTKFRRVQTFNIILYVIIKFELKYQRALNNIFKMSATVILADFQPIIFVSRRLLTNSFFKRPGIWYTR